MGAGINRSINDEFIPQTGSETTPYTVKEAFPGVYLPQPLTWFSIHPVLFTSAPQDSQYLYTAYTYGIIRAFPLQNQSNTAKTFLDISEDIDASGEGGLLGFAFHPEYQKNGKVYVTYSKGERNSDTARDIVEEIELRGDGFPRTIVNRRVLIAEFHNQYIHHISHIEFGPDGYLYIATGDGNAPLENSPAQNPSKLMGSVLRISVDSTSDSIPYRIPESNPFYGVDTTLARPEVWAKGFRMPYRFTFNPSDSSLILGDVGGGKKEEINRVKRGKNYGWPLREGTDCHFQCGQEFGENPIFEYDHSYGGFAVIGGVFYEGNNLPELKGKYIFGDNLSRQIWAWDLNGDPSSTPELIAYSPHPIWGIGKDLYGEVYIGGTSKTIYNLAQRDSANAVSENIPDDLLQSPIFKNKQTLKHADWMVPYSLSNPSWKNGLQAEYYFTLPGWSQFNFNDSSAWGIPKQSVFLQHLYQPEKQDSSIVNRLVETRMLVKAEESDRWGAYRYVWNEDSSQALRQEPEANCFLCHDRKNGGLIGFNTGQLNHIHDYNGVKMEQLLAFKNAGLFRNYFDSDAIDQYYSIPNAYDSLNNIEAKAKAYLHSNCYFCHNPDSDTRASIDFRFHVPNEKMGILNTQAIHNQSAAEWLADPENIEKSAILVRMKAKSGIRMPPVERDSVDSAGVKIITKWFEGILKPTFISKSLSKQNGKWEFSHSFEGLKKVELINLQGKSIDITHFTQPTYSGFSLSQPPKNFLPAKNGLFFIKIRHKTGNFSYKEVKMGKILK